MNDSEYSKVYDGSFILVHRIKGELEAVGIMPIIKDEGESQRLGGQGSINNGFQEVFVNKKELENAMRIINRVRAEMEA
jgi:hypothetical protein